jgi:hypothetical protein
MKCNWFVCKKCGVLFLLPAAFGAEISHEQLICPNGHRMSTGKDIKLEGYEYGRMCRQREIHLLEQSVKLADDAHAITVKSQAEELAAAKVREQALQDALQTVRQQRGRYCEALEAETRRSISLRGVITRLKKANVPARRS